MNGKGDKPRPFSVPKRDFGAEFDRIFRKKKDEQTKDEEKKRHDDAR